MKVGKKGPFFDMDVSIISGGAVLIRNHATVKKPRQSKIGWKGTISNKKVESY